VKDPKEINPAPLSRHFEHNPFDALDDISRRRFLSLLSASAALALGTSCSKIDRGDIVPYTRNPGQVLPGVAAYYASTFQEGIAAHSVLAKTLAGRPIHIEGNTGLSVAGGKTGLRAIGDLLGLYDPDRLRVPSYKGSPASWDDAQKAFTRALSDARLMDKPVLLLTGALISPTQKALLYDLKLALPNLQHAAWEPCAPYSEMRAVKDLYGESLIPRWHFERADVILALQSDFLGTDPEAAKFIPEFSRRRTMAHSGDTMNRLWVLEGGMTLTGANADQRLQVRPSQMATLVFTLVRLLNETHSIPLPMDLKIEDFQAFTLERAANIQGIEAAELRLLAADLGKAQQSALVMAGAALPPEAQAACHILNTMLGAAGNTMEMEAAPTSPDLLTLQELRNLLQEASSGKFALGIFWGANPAYAFPENNLWKRAVARIPETYRIGLYEDETALDCGWRLPDNHWLESWGDFEFSGNFIGLRQPSVAPIHNTLQAEELLVSVLRKMRIRNSASYLEYMKSRWRLEVYPLGSPAQFEPYWNAALNNGGVKVESGKKALPVLSAESIRNALSAAAKIVPIRSFDEMELILSPGAGVYDGRYANNGWLQELPDPVTKATWGNPLHLSLADAKRLNLAEEDVVRISRGSESIEAPVIIQPGQAPGVAAIALGYGRRTGNVAEGIGTNAFTLMNIASDSPQLIPVIKIHRAASGKRRAIPKRQTHNQMEGRNLARSWTVAEFSQKRMQKEPAQEKSATASLIAERKYPEHKWGMGIDLSACVGCSACVIACQSENNVPVVGPEQVLNGRDMQWIRIDRYYEGDLQNPQVRHQPMFCQQCDDAPCEIVCPVNATTHSTDGLNQMTYNRCIGTRYCSNNCPFKVRRFNFLDYSSMKKEPETLVYNPEVTIRPRGVMEKCTFCVQRIQQAKQQAKVEGRKLVDGEIQPACASACPAGAIVFGDLNDSQSRVAVLSRSERKYRLLEDLGVKPSVTYLVDICNPAARKGRA
jgi:Fe-S-cluster-containing dehydrogenase component/anaerobic selenocysteine-containing dehydrogenase